jgi:hypothetical protein
MPFSPRTTTGTRNGSDPGGAVFRGGGVPAGGFTDGAEIADDEDSRYEQDEPERDRTPDPKPTPDPPKDIGTPTTMPVMPAPSEPDISLPAFTPGPGINDPVLKTPQDKNGGTDQSAGTNNTKEKNATDQVSGEELNATMQAQGAASNDEATPGSPWWDPFGWTTSTGDTGTDEGPPFGILAAIGGALVVFYLNS